MQPKRKRIELSYILSPASGELTFSDPELFGELGVTTPNNTSSYRKLISEKNFEQYDLFLKQLVNEKGTFSLKYKFSLPDGQNVMIQDRGGLVEQKDRWPVVVGTISEVALEQEQMEHIEHLSLMGNLSAGLIHDFKNLIGGVQNIIEWCIMESRTQPGVSSALTKTIDYLEQANALMIGLLKLNDNQEAEVPVVLRLDHLVRDFEMLIKHICSAAIKVEIDVESGLNTIKAERSDIQEILLNLCVNAKNAMLDKGDLLLVSLKNVELDNVKHVCLSVTDNGVGMTEDVIAKIFDAYYTTSGSGTGLGLWMVHRKVTELNGLVEVKSKLAVGTTFNVYFPVTMNAKKIKTVSIDKVSLGKPEKTFFEGKKTILFIEDEPLIHSSVSKWLESMGFNVLAAEDGNTAYQLFCDNEQTIDLILQDYILPGLKGEELLSRFAASERNIPIIVMSAFSGEIDNSGIIDKGASAYLPKPFKINQLVELLSEYIN